MRHLTVTSVGLLIVSVCPLLAYPGGKGLFQADDYPFIENRGQLADMEGRPLRDVYFSFSAPQLKGYVTPWGLSLYFYRLSSSGLLRRMETMRREPWLGMDNVMSDTVGWERVDMELVGGCLSRSQIRVSGVSPWGYNYYLAHCLGGILDVRGYQEIRFEGVWPGVDWVLRYENGVIKQEFVVQAGYDYCQVRLRWWGVGDIQVGEEGRKLRVTTEYGELLEDGLLALYGVSQLPLRYHLISRAENEAGVKAVEVGYEVEGVQHPLRATLVLDPVLYWGTYFGGDGVEAPHCITTNASGELFVAGQVGNNTTNFPAYHPGGGAYQQGSYVVPYWIDAFIAKFTTSLSLAWCTYFGCPGNDFIHDIQTDPTNGNIYVTGYISGFPAHYPQFPYAQPNPNAYFDNTHNGLNDAFVARFSGANLSLQWSTLFGGNGNEFGYGIVIRPNGDVFICGATASSAGTFPLTDPGGGAYFDNALGGTNDSYVAMFRGSDLNLRWCTYLGGSSNEYPFGIAVHNSTGDILVVGRGFSTDFPTANPGGGAYFDNTLGGPQDGFISRFRSNDLALVWSTYFGGDGEDEFTGISAGQNIYIIGTTTSNNLPLNNNIGAYMQNARGGGYDLVIASFDGTNNAVRWSTYYGGQGNEISWVPQEVSVGVGFVAFMFYEIQNSGVGFSTYLMNNNCPSFLQSTFGGDYDVGFLVFTGTGQRVWSTFYGGPNYESWGCVQMVGSSILYAALSTTSNLPATTHLRNPGGGAYYDNTGSWTDVVLLRFDQVNCPLFYEDPDSMAEERSSRWDTWRASWEGGDLVIRGVREQGSYFVLSDLSGRVMGKWAVDTEEFRVSLSITPGVYILREETYGHVQKVVYSP